MYAAVSTAPSATPTSTDYSQNIIDDGHFFYGNFATPGAIAANDVIDDSFYLDRNLKLASPIAKVLSGVYSNVDFTSITAQTLETISSNLDVSTTAYDLYANVAGKDSLPGYGLEKIGSITVSANGASLTLLAAGQAS
jgi:hypothetical protein